MKQIKPTFMTLLYVAITEALTAAIGIENCIAGFNKLARSYIFHLPVTFMVQLIASLSCTLFTLLLVILSIRYLKKNKIEKSKIQKPEDDSHRLKFIEHDRTHRYY